MMIRNILLAMAIAACSVLSLGCFSGEKFTKPNFDTIYIGQNAGDVTEVLGQPTQRSEYVWTYVHNRPYYKGCIKVDQGRVIGKTWTYDKEGEATTMPTSKPARSRRSPM